MFLTTDSAKATFNLGGLLAESLAKGDIISLQGDLGSGKTIFVKGIAQALGFPRNKVVSSSFVLIREYPAKIPVYHFDLYRLKCKNDFLNLGYEDYFFGGGICLLEWGDRAAGFLPRDILTVTFDVIGVDERRLNFLARGKRYKEVVAELRRRLLK